MKKLSFVVLAIGLGVAACSDEADPPPQSASGVFPAEAFLGRKVRVEISGDNTNWVDGATVAMGDGITVDSVTVSSPTAIFADITVSDTATEGTHDVTVTSGKDSVTLKSAFQLISPIEVTIQGTVAQGSVALYTIKNRDFENLFDTTSTGDGFFTPLVFTNIDVSGPPGTTLTVDSVTPFDISGLVFIDVDAAAGGGPLTVKSGPATDVVTSPAGAPLAVMARDATPLTVGTPTMGMIKNPYDTQLYSLTPSATPALEHITIANPDATVAAVVLPESGHWSDLLDSASINNDIIKTGKVYVIPYDLSGTAGYTFTLRAQETQLAAVADTEPGNNTSTGATQATAATLIDNASLTDDNDQDWFKLTVPAGKKIHVVTKPGDPQTDALVEIFGPNNATTAFGQSDDRGYHEDFTSAATTVAGTYYVKISVSSFGLVPGNNKYVGAIVLE